MTFSKKQDLSSNAPVIAIAAKNSLYCRLTDLWGCLIANVSKSLSAALGCLFYNLLLSLTKSPEGGLINVDFLYFLWLCIFSICRRLLTRAYRTSWQFVLSSCLQELLQQADSSLQMSGGGGGALISNHIIIENKFYWVLSSIEKQWTCFKHNTFGVSRNHGNSHSVPMSWTQSTQVYFWDCSTAEQLVILIHMHPHFDTRSMAVIDFWHQQLGREAGSRQVQCLSWGLVL